ncbi:hypothetical protein J4459_01220 [Candidatus Woesearchaeota archaeon]|nr:hypothetical protein [Candidatus Woesearchaeota archaeon]
MSGLYRKLISYPYLTGIGIATLGTLEYSHWGLAFGLGATMGLGVLQMINGTGTLKSSDALKNLISAIRITKELKLEKNYTKTYNSVEELLSRDIDFETRERFEEIKRGLSILKEYEKGKRMNVLFKEMKTFIEESDEILSSEEILEMDLFSLLNAAERLIDTGEDELFKEYARNLIQNKKGKSLTGTKNDVAIESQSGKRVIVTKKGKLEDLESEKEAGQIIREIKNELAILFWDPNFSVTMPIEIIHDNDEFIYVMGYAGSIPISELSQDNFEENNPIRITRKKFEVYRDMARITAAIHRKFPLKKVRGDERSLKETIRKRFNGELSDLIISNLDPLEESILETELAYSKDAHPGNFGINHSGKITVFDTENTQKRRIVYDWVNITNHNKILSQWLKDQIARASIEAHKEFEVELDEEVYMRAYYNAGIARALELYPILEGRKEPEHNKALLSNAIDALGRIKSHHQDYHSKYQKEYEQLRKGIDRMLLMIDCNSTR